MSVERRILERLAEGSEPIDSPMTCSRVCGVSLLEARVALDSLARDGLVAWVPPERRWEITRKGRVALDNEQATPA